MSKKVFDLLLCFYKEYLTIHQTLKKINDKFMLILKVSTQQNNGILLVVISYIPPQYQAKKQQPLRLQQTLIDLKKDTITQANKFIQMPIKT